jgi:hypothetical protein
LLLVSYSSIDRSAVVNRVKFTPTTVADGQRTYRLEAEIALGQITSLVRENDVSVPEGI